ncbi:MAG: hypothetical protein ACF8R7_08670 [Phycisphaerales bacterium JB039]
MALILAGIDEAGYGPLLGPLCVGCAAVRIEHWTIGDPAPDLWRLLKRAVCRSPGDRRKRIAVADSKRLKLANSVKTSGPLIHLERAAASFLAVAGAAPTDDDAVLGALGVRLRAGWYAVDPAPFPRDLTAAQHRIDANTLRAAMATAGLSVHLLGCEAICEDEFNAIVRRTGSKAEATVEAIGRRLRQLAPLALRGDTVRICCDRLGGRIDYTEPLARELPGLPLTVLEQTPARSLYEIGDVPGACRIEFRPEAEDAHLPVALASILAKLTRELAMARLNRHFSPRLAGVRPTAGYRQDAGRWRAGFRRCGRGPAAHRA